MLRKASGPKVSPCHDHMEGQQSFEKSLNALRKALGGLERA